MKRYAINRLQEWKEDPYRLPMIIRGARQVGKTWLMQEFGRTAFEQCAYINFDSNERMQNLFSGDLMWIGSCVALPSRAGWRSTRRIL